MPTSHSGMEQAIKSLQEKMTVYEEILKETRRSEDRAKQSEDRLYRTVLTVLSTASVIFVALLGYNTWNISWAFNNITDKVNAARSSLEQRYDDALNTQRDEFTKLGNRLSDENREKLRQSLLDIDKANVNRYVGTFSQISEIWAFLQDPERSLDAAIKAFNKAMEGASNDWANALVRINSAIRLAIGARKPLPDALIAEVQAILGRREIEGDSRLIKLKETMGSYSKIALSP